MRGFEYIEVYGNTIRHSELSIISQVSVKRGSTVYIDSVLNKCPYFSVYVSLYRGFTVVHAGEGVC